ncbi:hypothetical protein ACPV5G_20585 [Photobacterium damselae]|uniref:hypothetical protein n=1 Tax=Photobacterium damselae TaxID=38293 RepID=UPI0040681AB5
MMVPVTDFLPMLRLMVDVPIPGVMEQALVQAAIVFCRQSQCIEKTRAFDEVYERQNVAAVNGQFGCKGKPQLKGAGIILVSSKGHPLKKGVDYTVVGLDKVVFKHDFASIEIHAFAEPIIGSTQLPASLYFDYCNTICRGAAAILQMQPNQTWTQPDLAQHNERLFVSGYREAFRNAIEQREYIPRPETKREFY